MLFSINRIPALDITMRVLLFSMLMSSFRPMIAVYFAVAPLGFLTKVGVVKSCFP